MNSTKKVSIFQTLVGSVVLILIVQKENIMEVGEYVAIVQTDTPNKLVGQGRIIHANVDASKITINVEGHGLVMFGNYEVDEKTGREVWLLLHKAPLSHVMVIRQSSPTYYIGGHYEVS